MNEILIEAATVILSMLAGLPVVVSRIRKAMLPAVREVLREELAPLRSRVRVLESVAAVPEQVPATVTPLGVAHV